MNNNGRLVYTPENGFSGVDIITYTITDKRGGESSAEVVVTVNEEVIVDTAPVM
ncbi:MAG: hypothetical protein GY827_03355 [Cytophagales bacterium]|nr:hypothetical protein [Cytophagales bacterium]